MIELLKECYDQVWFSVKASMLMYKFALAILMVILEVFFAYIYVETSKWYQNKKSNYSLRETIRRGKKIVWNVSAKD